jgi:hypothetical protein
MDTFSVEIILYGKSMHHLVPAYLSAVDFVSGSNFQYLRKNFYSDKPSVETFTGKYSK